MDAVIPAAGRSSRLDELTAGRPNGLVNVAGRSLLAHVFETAADAGADALVVIVGDEAGQIVDRFGDAFAGLPITYIHQRERLVLGHAMLQAEPHVDGTRREAGRPAVDARHDRVSRVARGRLSRVCVAPAVGRA
jgi:glucose-1-phosphate thymidylyltransferase